MFAIFTKYHGPTNTKGARISARFSIGGGKVSIPFPYELHGEACHARAALELIARHNPKLSLCEDSGDIPGGFVFIARQINY